MNRRSVAMLAAVAVLIPLVGCDTGDGKQLKPVDPAARVSTTTATTVALDATDAIGLPTVAASDGGTGVTAADGAGSETGGGFDISAPWVDGEPIEQRYTCDGLGVSPPLTWANPPADTVEIAVVMVDDSAVDLDGAFVHWAIAGIDPADMTLAEDAVPDGAVQALNFFGSVGYGGPCPPLDDEAHSYRITAYALNQRSELADGTPAVAFLDVIDDVTLASTDVTGTFRR